jgi:hypothetical protein
MFGLFLAIVDDIFAPSGQIPMDRSRAVESGDRASPAQLGTRHLHRFHSPRVIVAAASPSSLRPTPHTEGTPVLTRTIAMFALSQSRVVNVPRLRVTGARRVQSVNSRTVTARAGTHNTPLRFAANERRNFVSKGTHITDHSTHDRDPKVPHFENTVENVCSFISNDVLF